MSRHARHFGLLLYCQPSGSLRILPSTALNPLQLPRPTVMHGVPCLRPSRNHPDLDPTETVTRSSAGSGWHIFRAPRTNTYQVHCTGRSDLTECGHYNERTCCTADECCYTYDALVQNRCSYSPNVTGMGDGDYDTDHGVCMPVAAPPPPAAPYKHSLMQIHDN